MVRWAIGAIWHRFGSESNISEAYRTVETGRALGNWCHMAHYIYDIVNPTAKENLITTGRNDGDR